MYPVIDAAKNFERVPEAATHLILDAHERAFIAYARSRARFKATEGEPTSRRLRDAAGKEFLELLDGLIRQRGLEGKWDFAFHAEKVDGRMHAGKIIGELGCLDVGFDWDYARLLPVINRALSLNDYERTLLMGPFYEWLFGEPRPWDEETLRKIREEVEAAKAEPTEEGGE